MTGEIINIHGYQVITTKTIKEVAHIFKLRNKKKYDNFIIFEDDEGNGKSTANIQLAKEMDPTFSICPERIFNNPTHEQLRKAIDELPEKSYIDLDETGDIFYKRNWNKAGQKDTVVKLMKSRKKIKNIGGCIPRFEDLDEQIRNHRVMWCINVPYRGLAVVFKKDTRKSVDRWHFKENKIIMEKMSTKSGVERYKHMMRPDEYLNILRHFKGYVFDFAFNDLSVEDKKLYFDVVESNRVDDLSVREEDRLDNSLNFSKRNVTAKAIYGLFDSGIFSSQNDIAEYLGVSKSVVSYYINSWSSILKGNSFRGGNR